MSEERINQYRELISSYLESKINVFDFENKYLEMFKTENHSMTDEQFEILDTLFAAIDAFCSDETLRDEFDIDEIELRRFAKQTLTKL